MRIWKSDETLLSICILNFSFKNDFVWEEISNIRHSVSSPDETPPSSSKILRCASYFQLSSRCFIWWWNTASHVWYITYRTLKGLQIYFLTANEKKTFRRIFSYKFGCRKKPLSDFLVSRSSSFKKANTGRPA